MEKESTPEEAEVVGGLKARFVIFTLPEPIF